ncbi:UDP-glucose 4-epimerase [Lentinula aciculospora]|uniref:UDP-glucose 4-epimerase n=1 Tax=Lentinula aciculospora TaxID=153920 RepID=A0A9W8ZZN2_9AGAR|nr:UDP-glucose 4-epimerase [Lentinula aciculospora]
MTNTSTYPNTDIPPTYGNWKTFFLVPQNVIVTGGAGYIGSHIIYTLLKTHKYKVISIDNYHNSFPAALARVSELALSELKASLPLNTEPSERDLDSITIDIHETDLLLNPSGVRSIFSSYLSTNGIWGVIHLSAYKAVGESSSIPLTYYANNVSATISLLQIMQEFRCYRLIYSSSATVYGAVEEVPIKETTERQIEGRIQVNGEREGSVYGRTKVMCELIVEDLCESSALAGSPTPFQAISLRYFNPAGAHPSGYIGEHPRGRPENLLPLLAHMAVGTVKDPVLKVFGNDYPTPDGTCVRDYLHILDLAAGHVIALQALEEGSELNKTIFPGDTTESGSTITMETGDKGMKRGTKFKAYNLGKGHGMSVLQIVGAMKTATGFDYKTEVVGRRRGDVPELVANPALAQAELGFNAPLDLETMCRDLWNWQEKNPTGYE